MTSEIQKKKTRNGHAAKDGANEERKAVGVDPEIKTANLHRLRRIEGQVRGLQRMVEEDRYCADIIMQVASVQEALRSVGRSLMRNHLHHCAAHALSHGTAQESHAMYDELLELIYKHLR
jgi:CsoR family transcriptional regulator, copper-sensing transcriptional repressor